MDEEGALATSSGWRRLVENALIVAVAGGFANVVSLVLTFAIARLLSPSSYGAYSQLVGVFFVVAVPGSALGVAVVRRAGYYIVRGDHVLTAHWQHRLHRRVAAAAAILAVVALPVSIALAVWLGHRSWLAVWLVVLAGLVAAVLSVDRALLQSHQRYGSLAQNFVIEGVARAGFTIVGVVLGGVTGFALGLLLTEIVTRWHAYRLVRLRVEVDHGIELEHTGITHELLIALVTLGLMAILQFLDVFVIGHSNARGAGSYTAISQIAKTLVYLAVILNAFLLPEAVLANRKGADALRQLGVVLGLLTLPALVLNAAAILFPKQLLTLMFGQRYSHAWASLETLVLAMTFLAVSTILVAFLLGDGARWPTLWIGVVTLVGIAWVVAGHGVWSATATRDLQVQVVLTCGLVVASVLRLRRHGRLAVTR